MDSFQDSATSAFFLACGDEQRSRPPGIQAMSKHDSTVAQQATKVADIFQRPRMGHAPKAMTSALRKDALAGTLNKFVTPSGKALAWSLKGTVQVQKFHRRLFTNSSEFMRPEYAPITDRQVREAVTQIELEMGTVVHASTTGAMVQVFRLAPDVLPDTATDGDSIVSEKT